MSALGRARAQAARADVLRHRFAHDKARHDDYRAAFGSPAGERVFADLARHGHAAQAVHVPGDPYATAYNDGKRWMVLMIARILHIDEGRLISLAQLEETDR